MSGNVTANGRSILHRGHGMTHTCAPPDVCNTPSPAGPVPIPYVNLAMDSQLTDGASTVCIEGNPVANVKSKIATSSGDEPGTVGGVISGRFKGAMTWKTGSLDVKAEGESVVRFLDAGFHNGNSFNSAFINVGGTGFAYGDDQPCQRCGKSYAKHRVHETDEARRNAAGLLQAMNDIWEEQEAVVGQAFSERERMRLLNANRSNIRSNMAQPMRAAVDTAIAAATAAFQAANAQLAGTHLLVMDEGTDTYTQGYMIGVCICQCAARAVAACSASETPPGFRDAVGRCGLQLAENMPALSATQSANLTRVGRGPTWSCAAPKLINALEGHKPRTLTEMFYQQGGGANVEYNYVDKRGTARSVTRSGAFPRRQGVNVRYRRTQDGDTTFVQENFGSGETAPSCDRCKVNLPEMLCDCDELCP